MSEAHNRTVRTIAAALLAGSALAVVSAPTPAEGGGAMEDPLKPPYLRQQAAEPTVDPSQWRLSSTLVSDDRMVAIINDRVVGPGQTVDGARVISVERKAVRLRVGEVTFTIRSATPTVRTGGGS